MRIIVLGLAVFGLAAAAFAQEIQKLKRTTKASKELVVQGHVNINDACESREYPPEFDLDIPPKGGTVCTRSGIVRLASPWSDRSRHCIGRRINGVFVMYVPFGGFVGLDTLQYTVRVDPPQMRTYATEIRVETGPIPIVPKSTPSVPQTAGPMPTCPAFIS